MLMQGLQKFGLVVAVTLFGPLLLLSIFALAFNRTLGDQEYTKQSIEQAGFYKAVGDTIVTQASGSSAASSNEIEPVVVAALQSAVSGDKIQTTLEPLLDNIYAWLRGDVEQPSFALEIAPIKVDFEQSLTAALQTKAAGLPPCDSGTLPSGEDIYSYNCIPAGTDVNAAIADAVSRVSTNASIFSDNVVADGTVSSQEASDLGINDPTQNLPGALPRTYQLFTAGLWFFVASMILTGVGVVLLSRSWLYGIRKLGVLLLINGLGVLITGLLLHFVGSSLIPTTSVAATEAPVNALEQASKIVLTDNASLLKMIGITSVVTGVVGLISSTVLLGKRRTSPAPPFTPDPPVQPTKEKQPQHKL